jgi:putative hemolysin
MWLDLVYAIPIAAVLVILAGLFAGTEVAVFSLRRVDRDQMSKSGRQADKSVLALLALPRRLVTAVLIGIEAIIGAVVVVALGIVAIVWPETADSAWHHAGVTLAFTLPLVVLFGEVLPKTLALKNPIGWSRAAAWPLAAFALVMSPVRWVVMGVTSVVLRPLVDPNRARASKDLSEEEFKSLIDAGSAQGQVDARERRLIHRVFDFADKNVGQIMTPRERMVALAYDLPMQRLAKEVGAKGFSRIPIYQKSVDNIRGILNAKDLVRVQAGVAAGRTLGELLHDPLFIPRTTPVKRLFLTFKQKKVHMGIVVNEYGKVLGLVTMDDVLAQLFGALRDEREALQASSSGIPIRRGGAFSPNAPLDTGPVMRPDPAELTPVPRDPAELTPPEHTPPPHEVPAIIAAIAARAQTPPEDDPALAATVASPAETSRVAGDAPDASDAPDAGDPSGDGATAAETSADGEPVRRLRASTKDEDDQDEDDSPANPPPPAAPVPITDSDTGPSGPISVGGRSR